MSDYIDRLTEAEPLAPPENGKRSALGIPSLRCMVVGRRASCPEEIEEFEAAYLDSLRLPIPFWDENGNLEPLSHYDFITLEQAGVTPAEWEILTLEDRIERQAK